MVSAPLSSGLASALKGHNVIACGNATGIEKQVYSSSPEGAT
jgi:hypothetical protein